MKLFLSLNLSSCFCASGFGSMYNSLRLPFAVVLFFWCHSYTIVTIVRITTDLKRLASSHDYLLDTVCIQVHVYEDSLNMDREQHK